MVLVLKKSGSVFIERVYPFSDSLETAELQYRIASLIVAEKECFYRKIKTHKITKFLAKSIC